MTTTRTLPRKAIGWGVVLLALLGAPLAWFALDPGFRSGGEAPPPAATAPSDDFGQEARDFILDNPEVIVEAIRRLQARQETAELDEVEATLQARSEEVFRDPASPVGGNPEGDVTLVEFFDYNCRYCRQVAPATREAEAADPDLRVVYKEFPILGPNSEFAAKAALAAHRQDQYVAFHRALMAADGTVDENRVLVAAAETGLDVERLRADMNDPMVQAAIDRNLALTQALRITGTPGFVIGDQILRGATDLAGLQAYIRHTREGGS